MTRSRPTWGSITFAQWASRSDQEIAHALGVSIALVRARRRMFGHPQARPWLKQKRERATDPTRTDTARPATDRPRRGRPPARDWSAIDDTTWATRTNAELARELGMSAVTVAKWRDRLGAPASPAATQGRRR
jgi:hypothetical protein